MLDFIHGIAEIEQFGKQVDEIFFFGIPDVCQVWLTLRGGVDEFVHSFIDNHAVSCDGTVQYQSVERFAAAECHIYLAVRKSGGSIDDGMLECQALTFMNRDSPSRFERILGESAGHFFFDFFRLGIDGIFDVFPLFAVDVYCVTFFVGHFNVFRTDLRDFADLAVEIRFVGR